MAAATTTSEGMATVDEVGVAIQQQEQPDTQHEEQAKEPGLCCHYLRRGKCITPRPPCLLRHEPDDGIRPCFFGATCRNGHRNRVLGGMTTDERLAYWREFNARRGNLIAAYEDPAERDVTLLRSQLEPWSTPHLRWRLASVFGEDSLAMDALPRGQTMLRLLEHYENKCDEQRRKTVRVLGTTVDPAVCNQLLSHLRAWSEKHKVNSRPSICAASYMILRSPSEFGQSSSSSSADGLSQKQIPSKKARIAAKKIREYQGLWDLAKDALASVDPAFAESFSALAVTKGFRGSPHIDKQNTGPFYGLALGSFDDNTGGVCVEVDAFTVAHVNTKGRLGKIDGRYPHWVAPYTYHQNNSFMASSEEDGSAMENCRYSLIFYSTQQSYSQPGPAYFGELVEEEEDDNE
jgi:hypothetical protein